jgi:hypothetical protein
MVKEIPLKGGDVALVDDEDHPLLSRYKWQRAGSAGYAATTMQFSDSVLRTVYMHKLVMGGFWLCDHINRNPLDNRKENLRRATMQENGWNRGKQRSVRGKPPSSQYKGVSYAPLRGKDRWVVLIHVGKKPKKKVIRCGYFDTEVEAARAYNEQIVELRGEFAWVNPLPGYDENSGNSNT